MNSIGGFGRQKLSLHESLYADKQKRKADQDMKDVIEFGKNIHPFIRRDV